MRAKRNIRNATIEQTDAPQCKPRDVDHAGGNTERLAVRIPVVEVVLMEDRARVIRKGHASLKKGRQLLTLDEVSPVVSDRTLAVKCDEHGEGRIMIADYRVRRRHLVLDRDIPADFAELKERLRGMRKEVDELEDERAGLLEKSEMLGEALSKTFSDFAEDVGWGRVRFSGAKDGLAELEEEIRLVNKQTLEIQWKLEDLYEKMHDLQSRINAMAKPTVKKTAAIEIDLTAASAGDCHFTVEYIVPGACWRPAHTARLAPEHLDFSTDGCVWQNTGEDWNDVQLYFSTQRPSLGGSPPVLADDLISLEDKPDEEVVEAREQVIQSARTAGGQHGASGRRDLPGIDDAGRVQHLRAQTRVDVPSDGRPYRVPLSDFQSEVETGLVMMPELSLCAMFKSRQTNNGTGPLLAGPVDLIRDSGHVGRTSIMYVAPGEEFELGWGPDPAVRVKRHDNVKREKAGYVNRWAATSHRIVTFISNLSGRKKKIEMKERIPVSETQLVRVNFEEEKCKGNPTPPDDNGIVKWMLELDADGHATVELAYTIKKHKSVKGL